MWFTGDDLIFLIHTGIKQWTRSTLFDHLVQHSEFFHHVALFISRNLSQIPPRAIIFLFSLYSKKSGVVLLPATILLPAISSPLADNGATAQRQESITEGQVYSSARQLVERGIEVIMKAEKRARRGAAGGDSVASHYTGTIDVLLPPMAEWGLLRAIHYAVSKIDDDYFLYFVHSTICLLAFRIYW